MRRYSRTTVFFFFAFMSLVNAQPNSIEINRVKNVLKHKYSKALEIMPIRPDSAILLTKEITKLSNEHNLKKQALIAMILEASLYSRKKEFYKSDSLYSALETIPFNTETEPLQVFIHSGKAVYYHRREMLDSAEFYYKKSINTLNKFRLKEHLNILLKGYTNLAKIYTSKGSFSEAYYYLKQATDTINHQAPSKNILNIKEDVLSSLASLFRYLGDDKASLDYYTQALDIDGIPTHIYYKNLYNKISLDLDSLHIPNNIMLLNEIIDNKKDIYNSTYLHTLILKMKLLTNSNRLDEAGQLAKELKSLDKIKNYDKYAQSYYLYAAKLFLNQQKFREAEAASSKSLNLIRTRFPNQNLGRKESLNILIKAKLNRSKNTSTLNLFQEYVSTIDTLMERSKKNQYARWKIDYDTSIKEVENHQLQQQNQLQEAQLKTQKAYILGGGTAAVLFGLLASLFYRQRRRQERYNEILQSQNEKIDMLKREAIHRTNNHLNLATNLIAMQKNLASKTGAKEIIEDSERKLRAIAAANKRLSDTYDSSNNVKEVIDETVGFNIFNATDVSIEYASSIDPIDLNKSHLSILALIVNELTINSIKHAFHAQSSPCISITVNNNGDEAILTYRDNGDFKNINTINEGSALIEGLVDQLHGEMNAKSLDGFFFTLRFTV